MSGAKLQTFTNEELIFIYLRQERFLEIHQDVMADAKTQGMLGMLEIDTEKYLRLKNAPHIIMLEQINNKLRPIVELIQDSMPDMYNDIIKLVDNPLNEPDDDDQ
jgi:hypothetical protein